MLIWVLAVLSGLVIAACVLVARTLVLAPRPSFTSGAVRAITLIVLAAVAGIVPSQAATSSGISISMFRAAPIVRPVAIAVEPGGGVLFASEGAGSVGRITMSGAVTAHAVSAVSASGGVMVRPGGAPLLARGGLELGQMISERARRALSTSSAVEVAAGPGNTLWFTNGGETVGRITTTGKVAVFSEPQHLRGTYGITRGPDGAMWFTNYLASSIGRIDATGAIVTFTAPCVRYPMGITAGADGAMWFAGRLRIDRTNHQRRQHPMLRRRRTGRPPGCDHRRR